MGIKSCTSILLDIDPKQHIWHVHCVSILVHNWISCFFFFNFQINASITFCFYILRDQLKFQFFPVFMCYNDVSSGELIRFKYVLGNISTDFAQLW